MEGIIENIEIAGIASCVPKHFEDNMDYGNVLGERRVKRQIRLTGIRKRHTSNKNQRASDLAMKATEKLLEKRGYWCIDIYDPKCRLPYTFYSHSVAGTDGAI